MPVPTSIRLEDSMCRGSTTAPEGAPEVVTPVAEATPAKVLEY